MSAQVGSQEWMATELAAVRDARVQSWARFLRLVSREFVPGATLFRPAHQGPYSERTIAAFPPQHRVNLKYNTVLCLGDRDAGTVHLIAQARWRGELRPNSERRTEPIDPAAGTGFVRELVNTVPGLTRLTLTSPESIGDVGWERDVLFLRQSGVRFSDFFGPSSWSPVGDRDGIREFSDLGRSDVVLFTNEVAFAGASEFARQTPPTAEERDERARVRAFGDGLRQVTTALRPEGGAGRMSQISPSDFGDLDLL